MYMNDDVCMEVYQIIYPFPFETEFYILLRDESAFYRYVASSDAAPFINLASSDAAPFINYCKRIGFIQPGFVSGKEYFITEAGNVLDVSLTVNDLYCNVCKGYNIVNCRLSKWEHDLAHDIINVINGKSSVNCLLLYNHPFSNHLINSIDKMVINESTVSFANKKGIPFRKVTLYE